MEGHQADHSEKLLLHFAAADKKTQKSAEFGIQRIEWKPIVWPKNIWIQRQNLFVIFPMIGMIFYCFKRFGFKEKYSFDAMFDGHDVKAKLEAIKLVILA